jgi:glycosyltransferase involved in cell wall biosynthesis
VLWAARSLRLPVIYTIHGWSFHDELPLLERQARRLVEKVITSCAKINITVSDANLQTGKTKLGSFRSVVVKNGVNLQRFKAGNNYPDVKAAYGIPAQHLVIGYIVRITAQKDPLGMIRAFASLCHRYPNVTLLMVGEGDLKAAAMQLAASLNITDRIVFDNFRTDIPAVLNAVDIYCLPSLWEGFPIGILEAMAMGKAIVATDVDGTREAVRQEDTGLLVPAKDTGALTAALERLITDAALRTNLQANAQRFVSEHFEAGKMTQKIENIYLQLLSEQ